MPDRSHGYEKHALAFIRSRDLRIGRDIVGAWARELAPGTGVLELGCGHGVISGALVDAGLTLFAVDISPSLLQEFRKQFPGVATDCSTAEDSEFFGRNFDAVVAWGLMFLLEEDAQRFLLTKVAKALRPGGRFLFTAPRETGDWNDLLTGERSCSLGVAEYEGLLRGLGLQVSSGATDEGGNHYYCATKPLDQR